jgi:uncharacterized protein YecE (DUF72 family)
LTHRSFIGTCGWNYDHWRDVFYPKGLPAGEWLGYYAGHFDTVEINFSFYRLPERETFEKWAGEAPDGFTFAVKASRYLTHRKKLKDPEEPVERIIGHARGLGARLGPILFQLPPRWKVNVERLRYFLSILPSDLRYAVEFRDPSWYTDEVYDLLTEHSVALCIMSAPDLPRIVKATAPFVYIRMHNGGYDTEGNYEDPQLEWWAERAREFLESGDVYVYFNNDYKGFAVRNAEALKDMVRA